MTQYVPKFCRPRKSLFSRLAGPVSAVITLALLLGLLLRLGAAGRSTAVKISVPDIPKKFDSMMNAAGSMLPKAPERGLGDTGTPNPAPEVKKLNDADLVAPKPLAECYGQADTIEEMSWFEEKAAGLLQGQKLYFGPQREQLEGTTINYYLDDSIAVVTWKELVGYTVLTFAEVKIADGSQFRRFLADGRYGADTQYKTTEMAQTVNAVLASSGDFYKFHYNGIVVYEGEVRKVHANKADTCFIDDGGNLIFLSQDVQMNDEEAQKFVDENNIRFSLVFGPILVDDGVRCEPANYDLGEINSFSPRAALCQMDELHYLVVTANPEPEHPGKLDIHQFAQRLAETGCQKAYTLDGGQTAAIALDGELVNYVLYGQQRPISDIIYFATAVGG
ncbi:MAG: phosphodiester glycosidase family protein [Candidatus Faecousia sp.]|nr:phosphodiester glycosidase family protein [Candidatus Faecousia sp.]